MVLYGLTPHTARCRQCVGSVRAFWGGLLPRRRCLIGQLLIVRCLADLFAWFGHQKLKSVDTALYLRSISSENLVIRRTKFFCGGRGGEDQRYPEEQKNPTVSRRSQPRAFRRCPNRVREGRCLRARKTGGYGCLLVAMPAESSQSRHDPISYGQNKNRPQETNTGIWAMAALPQPRRRPA